MLCATIAVLVLGLVLATSSRAHDSLAPPGAHHNWLPTYEWVLLHWVPFDEADLDRRPRSSTPTTRTATRSAGTVRTGAIRTSGW